MKKYNNKIVDVMTGVVIGALVGLYHPLGEYHVILVVLAVVLGLRFLTALSK
jgi:uncharacterized membrane protein